MTLPGDPLLRRVHETPVSGKLAAGASSYFSAPTDDFDPSIIDGNEMVHGSVRRWILSTLYTFWVQQGYRNAADWSTVWIAGSGITHQWSAGRSMDAPGDLDVLIGVDFPAFYAANRSYLGTPESEMAAQFNDAFRSGLNARTANTRIGATTYEVTFYVNPAATDIRTIHPYAAYNLTTNTWTVRPPELPADWDPRTAFGRGWWGQWQAEAKNAKQILYDYRRHRADLLHAGVDEAGRVNIGRRLHETLRLAKGWFSSVHEERHQAFAAGGHGYMDYYNARWQAHKFDGTTAVMHMLAQVWDAAHNDMAIDCYGAAIPDARHALATATAVIRNER